MNSYGSGLGMALLFGLLIMVGALILTAILLWLSWKWSRPGASFFKLAFPSILPFLAIVIRIVQPLSVQSFPAMIWVGGWGAIALGILGRAIWLRPGEDPGPLSVRRRKRDIIFTTVVASILYTGWGILSLIDSARMRQSEVRHQYQEAENHAQSTAEWTEGRIVSQPGALCYSPDGRMLARAGLEDLEIWDLTTGKRYHQFEGTARKSYTNLQFDRSGTHLAMNRKHEVEIYDITHKRGPMTLLAGPEKWHDHQNHLCFLDDQDTLIVLSNGTAHPFHVDTGEPLPLPLPALQQSDIQAFAISKNNAWQATWSPGRKQIAAWKSGASTPAWVANPVEARNSPELQLSHDGHWLALTSAGGTLTVWNVETGIEQPLLSPKEGISVFRFTADGQQLVALQYGLSDSHAYIWNLVTGELAISHHLPIAAITGLVLDDRGGEFAANVLPSSNNERHFLKPTIQRFDTTTGAEHRGFSMPP